MRKYNPNCSKKADAECVIREAREVLWVIKGKEITSGGCLEEVTCEVSLHTRVGSEERMVGHMFQGEGKV